MGFWILADRNFGHDYSLPRLVEIGGSAFVFRLHQNAYSRAVEGTGRELGPADCLAGVVWDGEVLLP